MPAPAGVRVVSPVARASINPSHQRQFESDEISRRSEHEAAYMEVARRDDDGLKFNSLEEDLKHIDLSHDPNPPASQEPVDSFIISPIPNRPETVTGHAVLAIPPLDDSFGALDDGDAEIAGFLDESIFRSQEQDPSTVQQNVVIDNAMQSPPIPCRQARPVTRHVPSKPPTKPSPRRSRRKEPDFKIYVEKREVDILCCRGGETNNHPGNQAYLNVIRQFRPLYREIAGPHKKMLRDIVIGLVEESGAQFIKPEEANTGRWYIESESFVKDKVTQALREG